MQVIRLGGLELRFLHTGETTGGSMTMFEMSVPASALMPVPHYHESWEETVYGLDGVTTWMLDGATAEVGPGESLFIRRGQVHGFQNRSAAVARCLSVLTPGVLGPAYFAEIGALAAKGAPDPAAMRAVMLRHGLVPAPG